MAIEQISILGRWTESAVSLLHGTETMEMPSLVKGQFSMADETEDADGETLGDSPDMAKLLEDSESEPVTATVNGRPAAINDINVDLTAVLGMAEMKVSNLLKIGRGAVIELDRRVGDTVEIRVSGTAVARGEVVVVEDRLAVSVTEVVKKG